MLKFRFRRQNLRRRSNSCPNLECPDETTSEHRGELDKCAIPSEDVYMESLESGSEDESVSVPRKERLKAQRSVRRAKKKEKEIQENSEKNLLSMDDYYGKLGLLKEWLHEQGKKDIDKITSPKMKSHFKKFIKLWNKRKLSPKYYRKLRIDSYEGSSNSESLSSPVSTGPYLYGDVNKLPSYHRFPPIDEPDLAKKTLFTSPSPFESNLTSLEMDSPFATFGKATEDFDFPSSFMSFESKIFKRKLNLQESRKESSDENPIQQTKDNFTSPPKFATISRSTPASNMFKLSAMTPSPKLHPVLSPTCPLTFDQGKTLPNGFSFGPSISPGKDKQSPAYMCVKDAIHYESPEYSEIHEFVVKTDTVDISFSPCSKEFQSFPTSIKDKNRTTYNRRRSKSMEDIYAVPVRLQPSLLKDFAPLSSEIKASSAPPIPEKKFGFDFHSPVSLKENNPASKGQKDIVINTGPSNASFCQPRRNLHTSNFDFQPPEIKSVNIPSLSSKTSQHFHSALLKKDVKRRSQEKENVHGENKESPKKIKQDVVTHMSLNLSKPSILKGGINQTSMKTLKTAKENKNKKEETRLSILQIKQLDSSPTFPRRRVKRRSSGLSTTPGKGLVFGNKTPNFGKTSPRRVSFAKDVKDAEGKDSLRRSALRTVPHGKKNSLDAQKQSQDKADFESFWSSHEDTVMMKEKKLSPKQGGHGRVWSPPKLLPPRKPPNQSPPKESLHFKSERERFSPFKKQEMAKGSSEIQQSPKFDATNTMRRGLSLSLSPSKIASHLKKNLFSSSFTGESSKITKTIEQPEVYDRTESPVKEGISCPKPILKKSPSQLSSCSPGKSERTSSSLPSRQLGRRILGPPLPDSRKIVESQVTSTSVLEKNLRNAANKTSAMSPPFYNNAPYLYPSSNKFQSKRNDCTIGVPSSVTEDFREVLQSESKSSFYNKYKSSMSNRPICQDQNEEITNVPQSFSCIKKSDFILHKKDNSLPYAKIPSSSIEPCNITLQASHEQSSDAYDYNGMSFIADIGQSHHSGEKCDKVTHICHNRIIDTAKKNPIHSETVKESEDFRCASNPNGKVSVKESSAIEVDKIECRQANASRECLSADFESNNDSEGLNCSLQRLESMKASPNVVDNDSWITARRKSSVRRIKKASSYNQDSSQLSDKLESSIINEISDSPSLSTSSSIALATPTAAPLTGSRHVLSFLPIHCQGQDDIFDNPHLLGMAETIPKLNSNSPNVNYVVDSESNYGLSEKSMTSKIDTIIKMSTFPRGDDFKEIRVLSSHTDPLLVPTTSSPNSPSSCDEREVKDFTPLNQESEIISSRSKIECNTNSCKEDYDKEKENIYAASKSPKKPAILPKPSIRSIKSSFSQKADPIKKVATNPIVKKRTSLRKDSKENALTSRKSQMNSHSLPHSGMRKVNEQNNSEQEHESNLITFHARGLKPRNSLAPKKRRSRSSGLHEAGLSHVASFAERRKFFQQKEKQPSYVTLSSKDASANPKKQMGSVRLPQPRPPVKPKPRLSKIGAAGINSSLK